MSHNFYKRIEIRDDPIAYREFLCIIRGMLLIKHTDTLLRQRLSLWSRAGLFYSSIFQCIVNKIRLHLPLWVVKC